MHMRPHFLAELLLFLASAFACRSPLEQGPRRIVGLIDNGGLPIDPLLLPDTVEARAPFTATVSTFGSSCFRPDGADVRTTDLLADITPYDLVPPPESFCTADFRALPRPVTLSFATPGSGLIRLHGRGFNGDLTVQRSVTVRP
jgi:hypothetical protein